MNAKRITVPSSPAEITAAWLAGVMGVEVESIDAQRIGVGYGLASEVYRIALAGPRVPDSVVVKLWRTDGVAGTREVAFYDHFGPCAGLRIPSCFHALIDSERERGVLVLEDVRDAEQGDCLETVAMDRGVELARMFAGFHARWWNHDELRAAWLPSISEVRHSQEWFDSRRTMFLDRFEQRIGPTVRSMVGSLETYEPRANELLAGHPDVLLHADLHLDNVLFERGGEPVILDWARVARGPAVLDLSQLVFAMGRVREAATLIDAYATELRGRGIAVEGAALRRALSGALLRNFTTWTFGIAGWPPASPREERMIDQCLKQADETVEVWRRVDPEPFELAR